MSDLKKAKEELLETKAMYEKHIKGLVRSASARISKELAEEIRTICKKYGLKYEHEYGNLDFVTRVFVSNYFIAKAVGNDEAQDWDGYVRCDDFVEGLKADAN